MTIDVIDATDPTDAPELKYLQSTGVNPIVMRGMSGAVKQVVEDIIRRASGRPIDLLRFHGHGAPGSFNLAAGKEDHDQHRAGVGTGNINSIGAMLGRLKPHFTASGWVELHHCEVARGPGGETLLLRLAALWGVPVSAGVESQYATGSKQFVFEGPIVTARPDGSLSSGLPSSQAMPWAKP